MSGRVAGAWAAVLTGAAMAVGALAAPAAAQQPQKDIQTLAPQGMWTEKVREGLYLIRGPVNHCAPLGCGPGIPDDGLMHEPGDVAVRVTPEGVILVDIKFEPNVADVLAQVRTITSQPVKYVLNTHYHGDHVGGDSELLRRGIEVVVQKDLRASYARDAKGPVPHVTFGDYGEIHLGGATVEMHHFGHGHTLGDTFVYFPDLKVVHTGDVVIEGAPHIDYPDGGSAIGYVQEIYDLLKLDFDIAIPGHGRLLSKDEVRQFVRNFEIMNGRMKALVRQNVGRDRAGALLKLDDLGWAHTVSTSTFMGDMPAYYDEMARVVAAEDALRGQARR